MPATPCSIMHMLSTANGSDEHDNALVTSDCHGNVLIYITLLVVNILQKLFVNTIKLKFNAYGREHILTGSPAY